jgi:hypothetical protein
VDQIPKAVKGTVGQLLDKKDEMKNQPIICDMLGKTCALVDNLGPNSNRHLH